MQTLNVSYTTIKTVVGLVPTYYVAQGDGEFDVFAVGSDFFIRSRISNGEASDFVTNLQSTSVAVASADDALVLGSVANKVPLVQPRTVDGKIRIAQEKTDGDRVNFFSVDYTDPTTWYPQSTRVVNEVATDEGAETSYVLAHSPVIDSCHGKITGEDALKSAAGYTYRVGVTVTPSGGTASAKTEQDPHFGTGGDYTVDYDNGRITFLTPLNPTDAVKVTYYWVDMSLGNGFASRFTVAPSPGKKLSLEVAECQFSTDVNPLDTVVFEVWGIADYFIPGYIMALLGVPPGIGYKIKLQSVKYKSLSDFQNDAFKSYPTYPAMGDPDNWRSQKQPVTVFDWDYLTRILLLSSSGMEIRVFLEHDKPYEGWMATASFYCTSGDEK